MYKKPFRRFFFLACITAIFFSGCINYEEEIELDRNGSGKMLMHYSVPSQLTAMMAMAGSEGTTENKDQEFPFKLKEDEIKADLQAKGVRIEKVETKTEGDRSHFYVHLAFDKITDLNQTKTFIEMPFQWSKEGSTTVFRQVIKAKKGKAGKTSQEGEAMGKQMAAAMMGDASFNFKIKLPAKALPPPDTNGTILEDGKTVTWKFPITEVGESEKVMTAKFRSGLPLLMIAGFAAAGLVTLIAVLVILKAVRKT